MNWHWLWIYAIITTVVAVLTTTMAAWLVNEFRKKFIIMNQFVSCNPMRLIRWKYPGIEMFRKPMMRNIALVGQKQFSALIGIRIQIFGLTGFDYYGFVESDKNGIAVISTYLGKGKCTFQFYTTNVRYEHIDIDFGDSVQSIKPDVVFPPHWYQKIGLF